MTDAAAIARSGRGWVLAGALGLYAAAIAASPNLTVAAALAAPLLVVPVCVWTLTAPARWLALFFFAALLAPPLPIRVGDSGPHVAITIAALGVLAGAMRLGEWRFRPDLVTGSLLVYFAVLVASCGVAALYSGPEIAVATAARVLLFGISVYVFLYTAHGPASGAGGLKPLFWMAAASAAFACLDFYYQLPAPAGFGSQFVWLPSGVYRRAQGVFYDAMALGNLCAFFLTVTAAAWLRPVEERPLPRRALAAGGLLFAAALVLSFSRAALVNAVAALAVVLFLSRRRFRFRRLAALGGVAALSTVAVAAALPTFAGLYWGRLVGTAQFFVSAPEAVLSGRVDSWKLLAGFLAGHPAAVLVGVGYKTLPYTSAAGAPLIVDNMYLSALGETGIVGLLALLLFNFAVLRAALRASRDPDPRRSFFGCCLFAFWIGEMLQMFSGDVLTYWRVVPVYMWALGRAVRVPAPPVET